MITARRYFALRNVLLFGAPSIGVFSPAELFAAGEQGVWYDPSDFSTLFQDSAGTIPITAVEQPVGKILDKSGRGNHATQAVLASRPILRQEATGQYYLAFDGVDDCLSTGTITPGIDKAQAFVGLRKLSDVFGNIFELSPITASNNGVVRFYSNTQYYFASKGTTGVATGTTGSNGAPSTNVVTGLGDIAADVCIVQNNGVLDSSNAVDQGTGNYLAYPLFIGSRNNASVFFNGRLYSLILRFGANLTAGQISSTETYVNTKTGAY